MNNTKKCTKCLTIKDIDMFHNQKSGKYGKRATCKECRAIEKKEYREQNRDKILAQNKIYRSEHLPQEKTAKERFKKQNPNYNREYYQKHKELFAESGKSRYLKNKEEIREQQRIYYLRNKAKIINKISEWFKTDKGIISKRNTANKRRFQKYATNNNTIPMDVPYLLTVELQSLLNYQDNKCLICECEIDKNNRELDHWIPLSKNGQHTIENVCWLCSDCNRKKGATIPSEPLQISNPRMS